MIFQTILNLQFLELASVRDGGSSNTRFDLDRAHSYDVGVLLATLTYYSDSKWIDVKGDKTRRMKEILR